MSIKDRKIHIIMPMAGEGTRFKDAGYDVPKPLIEYDGRPLFINALDAVSNIKKDSISIVVRKHHNISDSIKRCLPEVNVIELDKPTRGAAETVYIAIKELMKSGKASMNDSIIIMDCDVIVDPPHKWTDIVNNDGVSIDGMLLTFRSNDQRYSYAATNNAATNNVISTAEKIVISDNAITSPYYIRCIHDFIDAFDEMEKYHQSNVMTYKEMYMSVLYNFLIVNGKHIFAFDVDRIVSLGTPEELSLANQMKDIHTVISDFDGTLVDTKQANVMAYKKAFEICDIPFDENMYKDKVFGLRFDDMCDKMNVPLYMRERLHRIKTMTYPEFFDNIIVNKALYDKISRMHLSGIRTVLASTAAKKNIDSILEHFGIGYIFDEVIDGSMVKKGKPDAEVYIKALNGVDPENVIVYEDSDVGVMAATAAGIKNIERVSL